MCSQVSEIMPGESHKSIAQSSTETKPQVMSKLCISATVHLGSGHFACTTSFFVAHTMEDVLPLLGSTSGSDDGGAPTHEKNNLGVVNGVFVPCMLNIVGAILFLRLSWAVGQAGFLGTRLRVQVLIL